MLPVLCVTCIRWSVNRLWPVHRCTVSDYNIPEKVTIYPPSVQLCCTQRSGHSEDCPTYNTDEDLDALRDDADGHIWCLWLATHHVCWVIIGIMAEVKAGITYRRDPVYKVNYSAIGTKLILPLACSVGLPLIFSSTISVCVFLKRTFWLFRIQMCCDSSLLCLKANSHYCARRRRLSAKYISVLMQTKYMLHLSCTQVQVLNMCTRTFPAYYFSLEAITDKMSSHILVVTLMEKLLQHKNCHNLLTLKMSQTCMNFFPLQNTNVFYGIFF